MFYDYKDDYEPYLNTIEEAHDMKLFLGDVIGEIPRSLWIDFSRLRLSSGNDIADHAVWFQLIFGMIVSLNKSFNQNWGFTIPKLRNYLVPCKDINFYIDELYKMRLIKKKVHKTRTGRSVTYFQLDIKMAYAYSVIQGKALNLAEYIETFPAFEKYIGKEHDLKALLPSIDDYKFVMDNHTEQSYYMIEEIELNGETFTYVNVEFDEDKYEYDE